LLYKQSFKSNGTQSTSTVPEFHLVQFLSIFENLKILLKTMAKKKINDLSDLGGFVFSTNEEEDFSQYQQDEAGTLAPEDQSLEAHFSNKGRGGKTVTIIKGFKGKEEDLKALAKHLKTRCSVGGSVKDGEIIIQGNYRDKVMELLRKEGYQVKRIGG
jgi:translation initiation factor 1